MVHNFWVRPKTSLGLPASGNHSSILQNLSDIQSDSRRATREYFPRESFGEPLVRNSTTDLSKLTQYDRSSDREAISFKSRIEGATRFLRKALQPQRDISRVPELISTDSGLNVNTTPSHLQSSRPLSIGGDKSQNQDSTLTRWRSMRGQRARRNAIGRAPSRYGIFVPEPFAQDLGLASRLDANEQAEATQASRPQHPVAGAGARAAAAAAREPTTLSSAEPSTQPRTLQNRTPRTGNSRGSNNAHRTAYSDRSDSAGTTRSRQHESPDMGQKGYDEITQREPAVVKKKIGIGKLWMLLATSTCAN